MSLYSVGPPWPDPTTPVPGTHWGNPVSGHVAPSDGSSTWGAADPPGGVPPAVEPVSERVGWTRPLVEETPSTG